MYCYNLDLGESYYSHVAEHGSWRQRGETPGPLSYSERIARHWCGTEDKVSLQDKLGFISFLRQRFSFGKV